MTEKQPTIELYTDGACSGNPGPGGWAVILKHPASGKVREVSGFDGKTTNNVMELMAVIRGLELLTRPSRVDLFTDSQYVAKGLTEWMKGWKRNGWKRREKGRLAEVKNVELWQRLDALAAQHSITAHWVRGHDGHEENERCDRLAVAACESGVGTDAVVEVGG